MTITTVFRGNFCPSSVNKIKFTYSQGGITSRDVDRVYVRYHHTVAIYHTDGHFGLPRAGVEIAEIDFS